MSKIEYVSNPATLVFVPHEGPPEGTSWKEYFKITSNAKDVWHALYQALDRVSDATSHEVRVVGQEIDQFESNIFSQSFDPQAILSLKRRLSMLEHSIEHLPSLAKQLQNFYQKKDDLTWKWRDLFDHCERSFRNVEYHRSHIGSTIELYWGHQSHKTNRQIRKLSTLASMAVPLTFWASFWGMNFEAIPFSNPNFFYGALAVMLVSSAVALWYLVRRGYWND